MSTRPEDLEVPSTPAESEILNMQAGAEKSMAIFKYLDEYYTRESYNPAVGGFLFYVNGVLKPTRDEQRELEKRHAQLVSAVPSHENDEQLKSNAEGILEVQYNLQMLSASEQELEEQLRIAEQDKDAIRIAILRSQLDICRELIENNQDLDNLDLTIEQAFADFATNPLKRRSLDKILPNIEPDIKKSLLLDLNANIKHYNDRLQKKETPEEEKEKLKRIRGRLEFIEKQIKTSLLDNLQYSMFNDLLEAIPELERQGIPKDQYQKIEFIQKIKEKYLKNNIDNAVGISFNDSDIDVAFQNALGQVFAFRHAKDVLERIDRTNFKEQNEVIKLEEDMVKNFGLLNEGSAEAFIKGIEEAYSRDPEKFEAHVQVRGAAGGEREGRQIHEKYWQRIKELGENIDRKKRVRSLVNDIIGILNERLEMTPTAQAVLAPLLQRKALIQPDVSEPNFEKLAEMMASNPELEKILKEILGFDISDLVHKLKLFRGEVQQKSQDQAREAEVTREAITQALSQLEAWKQAMLLQQEFLDKQKATNLEKEKALETREGEYQRNNQKLAILERQLAEKQTQMDQLSLAIEAREKLLDSHTYRAQETAGISAESVVKSPRSAQVGEVGVPDPEEVIAAQKSLINTIEIELNDAKVFQQQLANELEKERQAHAALVAGLRSKGKEFTQEKPVSLAEELELTDTVPGVKGEDIKFLQEKLAAMEAQVQAADKREKDLNAQLEQAQKAMDQLKMQLAASQQETQSAIAAGTEAKRKAEQAAAEAKKNQELMRDAQGQLQKYQNLVKTLEGEKRSIKEILAQKDKELSTLKAQHSDSPAQVDVTRAPEVERKPITLVSEPKEKVTEQSRVKAAVSVTMPEVFGLFKHHVAREIRKGENTFTEIGLTDIEVTPDAFEKICTQFGAEVKRIQETGLSEGLGLTEENRKLFTDVHGERDKNIPMKSYHLIQETTEGQRKNLMEIVNEQKSIKIVSKVDLTQESEQELADDVTYGMVLAAKTIADYFGRRTFNIEHCEDDPLTAFKLFLIGKSMGYNPVFKDAPDKPGETLQGVITGELANEPLLLQDSAGIFQNLKRPLTVKAVYETLSQIDMRDEKNRSKDTLQDIRAAVSQLTRLEREDKLRRT